MIVLDTSYLIDFFRGERRTLEIMNSDVATTVVTYYEILSGIGHKKARREERFFKRFFSEIRILEFDLSAAEKSSEIMANLMTAGRSVNSLDVLISGIAIANGAEKIVTGDKDFIEISKVSELKTLSILWQPNSCNSHHSVTTQIG
jgi:predicted nucleic acid-binding protein